MLCSASRVTQGLKLVGDMTAKGAGGVIGGGDAFKLYDSLGFPVDLTCLVAKQVGVGVGAAVVVVVVVEDDDEDDNDEFVFRFTFGLPIFLHSKLTRAQAGWGVDMQVCASALC
jgi:hypothetical protein